MCGFRSHIRDEAGKLNEKPVGRSMWLISSLQLGVKCLSAFTLTSVVVGN